MDVDAIREELAVEARTAGWNVYAFTPGAANLPAVVVGVPERIAPLSGALWQITIPVYVLNRSADPAAAESRMLTKAIELAAMFKAPPAVSPVAYRSRRMVELTDFYDVTVGTTEANACTITVEVLATAPD